MIPRHQTPSSPPPPLLPAVLLLNQVNAVSLTPLTDAVVVADPVLDHSPPHTDVTYPGEGLNNVFSDVELDSAVLDQRVNTSTNAPSTTTAPPPPDLSATGPVDGTVPPPPPPLVRASPATGDRPPMPTGPPPVFTSSANQSRTGLGAELLAGASHSSSTAAAIGPPGTAVRRHAPAAVVLAAERQASGPFASQLNTTSSHTTSSTAYPHPYRRNSGTHVSANAPTEEAGLCHRASPHAQSISEASYLSLTERSRSADAQLSFASHSASGSGARTMDGTRQRRRLYGAVGPPPAPPSVNSLQQAEMAMDSTAAVRRSSVGGRAAPVAPSGGHSSSSSSPAYNPNGSHVPLPSTSLPMTAGPMGSAPSAAAAAAPPPLKGYRYPASFADSFTGGSLSLQAAYSNRYRQQRSPSRVHALEAALGAGAGAGGSWSLGRGSPARSGRDGASMTVGSSSLSGTWGPSPRRGVSPGRTAAPGHRRRTDGGPALWRTSALTASQRQHGSVDKGRFHAGRRVPLHWSLSLGTSQARAEEDLRQQALGPNRWPETSAQSPLLSQMERDALDDLEVDADRHVMLESCAHCGRRGGVPRHDPSPGAALTHTPGQPSAAGAGAGASFSSSVGLMECPCELVAYCSAACQLSDWPAHASHCVPERQWVAQQFHQDVRRHSHTTASSAMPLAARAHPTSADPAECLTCGFLSCTLLQCRCGEALYCSPECQVEDWPCHRYACVEQQEGSDEAQRESLDMTQTVKALLAGEFRPSQAKHLAARLGLVASVSTQTMPLDVAALFPYATNMPAPEETDLSSSRARASSPLAPWSGASTKALGGHGQPNPSPVPSQSNALSCGNSLTMGTQGSFTVSNNATPPPQGGGGGGVGATISTTSLSLSHAGASGAMLTTTMGAHIAPYSFFGGRSILLGFGGFGGTSGSGSGQNVKLEASDTEAASFFDGAGSARQHLRASTNDDLESLILTRMPSRVASTAATSVRSHRNSPSHSPRAQSHHPPSFSRYSTVSGHGRRGLEGPGHARPAYTSSRRGSIAGGSLAGGAVSGVSSFYGTLARYGHSSFCTNSTGSGSTYGSDHTSGTETTGTMGSGARSLGLNYSAAGHGDPRRDPQFLGGARGRGAHASTGLTAVLITSRILISDEERDTRQALREQFMRERIGIELRTLVKHEADARMAILYEEVMWCVKVGDVAWKHWKTAVFNFYYRR